jgi:hypothetical protein
LHIRNLGSVVGIWKILIRICQTLIIFSGISLANPVFTGDAYVDFLESGAVRFDDPGGMDVGLPPQFPAGTITGWDVKALYLFYNRSEDTMFVGVDFYGIAGDADGDGDPGRTGQALASLGGVDEPDLGGTESVVLLMDTNMDKKYELAVGVNGTANISSFGTYNFVGRKYAPAFGFGERLSPDPATLYASPDPPGRTLNSPLLNSRCCRVSRHLLRNHSASGPLCLLAASRITASVTT